MTRKQSNRLFFVLMGLAFIVAFFLPAHFGGSARAQLEAIFFPVSRPVYLLGNWARHHWDQSREPDARDSSAIAAENLGLRQEVTRLAAQVQRLSDLAGERQRLGNLQDYCQRYTVAGIDAGARDGLILAGAMLGNVREDQPVVYTGGLVGRIDRAGAASAHAQLLTDMGFTVSARFVRFQAEGDRVIARHISELAPIVEGAGQGQIHIVKLGLTDVRNAAIAAGDWLVIADPHWPDAIQGVRVGRVESIGPLRSAPQFAEIRLSPQSVLTTLTTVWVMTRAQPN